MAHDLNSEKSGGIVYPYSLEVEQAVLGCLLVKPDLVDDAADLLFEDDFFVPAHRRIFRAVLDFAAQGRMASPVSLKAHFSGDKDLESVGGGVYLAELAASIISTINITDYMTTLRDYKVRRALVDVADRMGVGARDTSYDGSGQAVLEEAETALFSLAENGRSNEAASNMAEVMMATISQIGAVQEGRESGLMTGLPALDQILNGFWPADLIVLAGRPSMGKTAAALTIARNVAGQRQSVLMFSLEMSKAQIGQRLIARETGIATGMQNRRGSLSQKHFTDIYAAHSKLCAMPLSIDDSATLNVAQIRARARRHKRKFGLDLVIIDQLSLIDMGRNFANKVDQIGEVTRGLKILAKELGVPVILLHQLSREVEKREDKRPMLSDLRDSGNIEQDADTVIFLFRDEYYLEKNPPSQRQSETDEHFSARKNRYHDRLENSRGKADVIVAKLRQGQCGDAKLGFNGVRQMFFDLNEFIE